MDSALEHAIGGNQLNNLYFSNENISAIQHGIRYTVFKETDKVIDVQDERELLVVMRSIYLQYGKNLPSNIVSQVKQLNKRVLETVIPKIITEMNQYQTYLRDASALPIPLDRGESTSSKGTKFLVMDEF